MPAQPVASQDPPVADLPEAATQENRVGQREDRLLRAYHSENMSGALLNVRVLRLKVGL